MNKKICRWKKESVKGGKDVCMEGRMRRRNEGCVEGMKDVWMKRRKDV